MTKNGEQSDIDLTPDDIVFVTNGSITESSTYGDQNTPAPITHDKGSSWKLWENLAKQDPDFGHPDVFCENLPERSWFVSATATLENKKIAPYFERLTKRSLYDGKVNTGGIITVVDSNWELSFTIHRQPHFKSQNPDQIVVWIYALYSDTEGNYIKKRVVDCTGKEIAEEMLYHLGVPESQISELASEENMNTVPVTCHISLVTLCLVMMGTVQMLFQKDQLILPLLAILPNHQLETLSLPPNILSELPWKLFIHCLTLTVVYLKYLTQFMIFVNCFVRCTTCLTRRN